MARLFSGLLVYKAAHRLELWQAGRRLAWWPISLGLSPHGHKRQQGDNRTPEGRYFVCTRNPRSKYHLSFGLSYPNAVDAAQALAQGRIDSATAAAIRSAAAACRRPPWDTPLGGAIMIHGQRPTSAAAGPSPLPPQDWTAGCIAVSDAVMDWLWLLIPLGCPVMIYP